MKRYKTKEIERGGGGRGRGGDKIALKDGRKRGRERGKTREREGEREGEGVCKKSMNNNQ